MPSCFVHGIKTGCYNTPVMGSMEGGATHTGTRCRCQYRMNVHRFELLTGPLAVRHMHQCMHACKTLDPTPLTRPSGFVVVAFSPCSCRRVFTTSAMHSGGGQCYPYNV